MFASMNKNYSMENIKVAVVMNGGGARGSFVVGALEYIQKNVRERIPRLTNLEYSIFFGSSTNAFTALMLGMGKYDELIQAWEVLGKTRPRPRYRLRYAWNMLTGAKGINSSFPLDDFIRKYVRREDLKKRVLLPLASFKDGQYFTLNDDDFETDEDLQNAAMACMRVPGFNPPVKEIRTRHGIIKLVVDGSALRANPIGDVLAYDPDVVFIISATPCPGSRFDDLPILVPGRPDALSLARAMYVEAAPEKLFSRDLGEFLKINELVREASYEDRAIYTVDGSELRYYNNVIVCPREKLSDVKDYSPEVLKRQRNMGYIEAQRVFKNTCYMRTDVAPDNADTMR
jgi:predicted acylesterase/phospholipase RssA